MESSQANKQEFLFATADVPNSKSEVFTEDCLRDLALHDPRCRYDENTKQLWMTVESVDIDPSSMADSGNPFWKRFFDF